MVMAVLLMFGDGRTYRRVHGFSTLRLLIGFRVNLDSLLVQARLEMHVELRVPSEDVHLTTVLPVELVLQGLGLGDVQVDVPLLYSH